jgi:hypothetical protein
MRPRGRTPLRQWGPSRAALAFVLLLPLALPATATAQGVPQVNYSLSTAPNANGWHRIPVTVHWFVSPNSPTQTPHLIKATGCSPGELVDVQTSGTVLTCRAEWDDGTVITRPTKPLKIDWTPPSSIGARAGRPPDSYGWYGRPLRILFSGTDALSGIAACSRPVYKSPNTAKALSTGACVDRAGNSRALTVTFKYHAPIVSPRPGRKVARAPLIDWVSMPNARRFNVQVWHKGQKVLSRFPKSSRFQMPRSWIQDGVRYRMQSARYDVYVWPRFRRYGKLVGHTYFIRR